MGSNVSYVPHTYPTSTMVIHQQHPFLTTTVDLPHLRRTSSHMCGGVFPPSPAFGAFGSNAGGFFTTANMTTTTTSNPSNVNAGGFSSQLSMPVQYYPQNLYGNGVTTTLSNDGRSIATVRPSIGNSGAVVTISHFRSIPNSPQSQYQMPMSSASAPPIGSNPDEPPSYDAVVGRVYPKLETAETTK